MERRGWARARAVGVDVVRAGVSSSRGECVLTFLDKFVVGF